MRKFIQQKLKEQKGLTLIELLAVIVILAIIAAIAIPAIGNIIENSRHNAARADVQNVLASANLYFTENGSPDTTVIDQDDLATFVDDFGNVTKATVTKNSTTGNTIAATVVTDQGTYNFTTLNNNGLSDLTAANINALFTPKP